MASVRLTPIEGMNLDLGNDYFPPTVARYIKNLSYQPNDTSEAAANENGSSGKFKPLISSSIYDAAFRLPAGENRCVGAYGTREGNYVVFHNWNSNGFHGLYKINGGARIIESVKVDACWNYQMRPENFMHEGGSVLEVLNFVDPVTNLPRTRSFYMFTDGFNDFRFICLEDAIATQGFSETLFPYFSGSYDRCRIVNAGVSTPDCCIGVKEVVNTDPSQPNNLKYKTWKFFIRYIDVYGRMSEWSEGSDLYIPGGGSDCLGASDAAPRCLDLTFCAGNPLVDKIDIAYTNCDGTIAYKENTLFLYEGSNLGDWWLRKRNPEVEYDPTNNEITYRFCDDKECIIVPAEEFVRTQNPMPRTTQSAAKIGSYISLGNNKHGFSPLPKSLMDGVNVAITKPAATPDSGTRNIEIWVPIFNPVVRLFQPIWGTNNETYFGGFSNFNAVLGPLFPNPIDGVGSTWGQKFADGRTGFIGLLSGGITTVSEQYYIDNGNFVRVDANLNIMQAMRDGRQFYQRFYFPSVKKGQYYFRILGHGARLSDGFKEKTSTYTAGVYSWDGGRKLLNYDNKIDEAKELFIDVCNGDYSSLQDNKILLIYDLAGNDRVIAGYLFEEQPLAGEAGIPVELARIKVPSSTASVRSAYTDHNGFYFVAGLEQDRTVEFIGMCNCSSGQIAETSVGNIRRLFVQDVHISQQRFCSNYATSNCNRAIIRGKVVQCDTGVGIPGVAVTLGKGGTTITAADGSFSIIAHDDMWYDPMRRMDALVYSPTTCAFTDCDGNCIPYQQVLIFRCVTCVDRFVDVSDRQVKFNSYRGLLSGGSYGVGIEAVDWLGRHSFVQTKDKLYFTVPTAIDTQTFAPSSITLNISPGVTFPEWVEYLNVKITKELSIADYITWIADKVEFIDNTGAVNTAAPTQIRIYYGSILEYNEQTYNTTAHWQFINTVISEDTTFTNDYVEFYRNGNGSFFPTLIRKRVRYDKIGTYFLIDYDSSLRDLKENAVMRLARPSECVSDGQFFGLCAKIPVVNGKAQITSLTLNAFDTYYLYRDIPVPVTESENVQRSFGFPFEHHSPSDFWGDHCANFGRPNTKNPYEAEIQFENQIALSGALSASGQLNYLNYFSEKLTKNFNSWNFGGIVSILPETGSVLVVCQNDTFVVGFDDNLLRQTSAGIALQSGENEFGRPERKIGGNYGCRLYDKNTIRKKEGLVHFLSTQNPSIVQHNFAQAIPVSDNGVDGFIRAKIKYVQEWNRNNPSNKKYFVGAIDGAANTYLLTDFKIENNAPIGSYVNDERGLKVERSETICFNFAKRVFRQFVSFTPEYYATLESNTLDVQLFSFKEGRPWFHYTTNPQRTYNNFFGVQCEMVIRTVAVIDPYVKKKPLAVNALCPQSKFFIDQAITDSGNQVTRVLLEHWKKGLYYTSAPLLCDLNTVPTTEGGATVKNVTEGDMLYGSIIDLRFISDPATNGKYCELLGFELYTFEASPTKQK